MDRVNVLLVVRLESATPWQLQEFDRSMAEQDWFPMANAGWYATEMQGAETDQEVVELSEFDLQRSAAVSGIKSWDSVCLLSESSS